MKSVVIDEPRKVSIHEIAEPQLMDDVLPEMQYTGLCGSDLSTYRGLSPLVTFPRIPGNFIKIHIDVKA